VAHEFDSGMFVRQPAWHHLGTVVDEYPGSWDECRKLAGIDWDPITEPVFKLDGFVESEDGTVAPRYTEIGGFHAVNRSDTHSTLSVQADSYHLIDHTAMGEIFDAVLDQTPNLKYETAGSLAGGAMIWALIRLDEPFTIKGDFSETMPYVALTNRHDGRGGCNLTATSVRIVCANTWKASEMEAKRTGLTYSFRHTKNWRDRVEDARNAITGARKEFRAYAELAEELMLHRVTRKQTELFIREFIPMPPDGIVSDRVARNVEEARTAIREILASETTAPVAHTVYGLVQAAGEYLDHVRSFRNTDSLLGRQLLKPQALKGRATKMAMAASKDELTASLSNR
jgi:phage/plasmid-like protein (TIGR03299 family)